MIAIAAAATTYGGLALVPVTTATTEPASLDVAAHSKRRPDIEASQDADHLSFGLEDGAMTDLDTIDPEHRTVALDRSTVLLPVETGLRIEVVALLPTVESVVASVIAESAIVVAVDESVVVIRLTTDEARQVIEAAATGSLVLLGTD